MWRYYNRTKKEKGEKMMKRISLITALIITLAICLILLVGIIYYGCLYEKAIHQGAEDVVTALELTTACQILTNVSMDDIKQQWIKTFLLKEGVER